ncbi:helix loop helix domain [Rhizoctonia solani]|uniref:Helix loop helix domain n=1 Tax=Rhizoctonia solani TaxID=456999 RepID=A0A8H7LET2_9AGAM|nr:helix loop helix domain [Rhizoctonia solani]
MTLGLVHWGLKSNQWLQDVADTWFGSNALAIAMIQSTIKGPTIFGRTPQTGNHLLPGRDLIPTSTSLPSFEEFATLILPCPMTLLGQHEYVEYSPLFIAMDPRVNPNAYGTYVYQSSDPRTVDASTSWGMYSPTYAHSTIAVAQGKEHLQSATSALMSLQSEPSHTPDQYGPIRPLERHRSSQPQSERQNQDDWRLDHNQATPSSLLGFDSQLRSNPPFGGQGNYLQGAHRWASNESSPSTPTPGPATDGPSYLSGTNPTTNYSSLVTHAPQPLHAQSASAGSQFMALRSDQFPPALSPPTILPPHHNNGGTASASSQPPNLRRRSSTSNSVSSSNNPPGSSLGLHVAESIKGYSNPESSNAKLARNRGTLNLTGDSGSSSIVREKPKLLTKDQKKRNHIHSEQKRRATIRHGYALLCEEVPSLRMAIAAAEADDVEHAADGEGRRRRRSRARSSAADGERIDGRAGPRSESVVLIKTIDHLKDLLATRQELISRVQELRAGDPGGDSPWERTWGGGTGLAPEGVDDDGEEDGEGESDEADN